MNDAKGDRPIRVFGLGLNRTGTGTLRAALRGLGYSDTPFKQWMMQAWAEGKTDLLIKEADAFDIVADLPWPLMFRELHAAYGDSARYVLTTRKSTKAWIRSQKSHTERTAPGTLANQWAYGYAYPHGAEPEYKAIYERHNNAVRAYFDGQDGIFAELCWERGDGWPELARLLGIQVPEMPFPHSNQTQDGNRDTARVAENRKLIRAQRRKLGRGFPWI